VSSRAWVVAGFAVLLATMLAVDLLARRRVGPGPDRVTGAEWDRNGPDGAATPARWPAPLASALVAGLRTPAGRLAVYGWWLWLGWHFLAR
jgi:hypothetical protein